VKYHQEENKHHISHHKPNICACCAPWSCRLALENWNVEIVSYGWVNKLKRRGSLFKNIHIYYYYADVVDVAFKLFIELVKLQ
jgi:hypothetical protein